MRGEILRNSRIIAGDGMLAQAAAAAGGCHTAAHTGQNSRHDIIVFKDETAVITGMAIDEFPEVKFRERPDPDV